MKNVFVPTENYQQLKAECEGCMSNAHGVEMVAVVGRAGRGKTTAAERIAVEIPDARFIRLDPGLSPAGFLREATFALTGDRRRTMQDCRSLLAEDLSRRRLMLMADEADRLCPRHLNALRDLHDLYSVPVVLIGEELLIRKLEHERRLISRMRKIIRFEPVTQTDIIHFYRTALEQSPTPGQIASLAHHCGGDFRQVITDAISAERYMKVNGLKKITDEVVAKICGNGVPTQEKAL
jgi:DNA transposition AAA+ family ATPase